MAGIYPAMIDASARPSQNCGGLNYPFDFAFFAYVTPRPFPKETAVEILTAPPGSEVCIKM